MTLSETFNLSDTGGAGTGHSAGWYWLGYVSAITAGCSWLNRSCGSPIKSMTGNLLWLKLEYFLYKL